VAVVFSFLFSGCICDPHWHDSGRDEPPSRSKVILFFLPSCSSCAQRYASFSVITELIVGYVMPGLYILLIRNLLFLTLGFKGKPNAMMMWVLISLFLFFWLLISLSTDLRQGVFFDPTGASPQGNLADLWLHYDVAGWVRGSGPYVFCWHLP